MRTTQSLSYHALLNHHLDAFELAWQAAARHEEAAPDLNEFLQRIDDEEALPLLANLVAIDLNWRWKLHGAKDDHTSNVEVMNSKDYFERFPKLLDKPNYCRDIVCAEYRSRRAAGDVVSPNDLLADYGDTAELEEALRETEHELQLEDCNTTPPKIDGFEIAEELGRGGRGVVYKAWEISLRRFVAIKVLHRSYSLQLEDRNRFRREAETLARLKHPRVVALHAISEADEQLYLIMEWVDGKDLGQMLAEGYLPIPLVVSLLIDVADAVQHAHERGVLHRDLKPANILVDGNGFARVTDFGLAKELRQRSEAGASTWLESQTKAIVGTPCFMPPEQVDASRGAVGVTSDVYAIGATLYCLLTGRPPARGSTTWETFRLVLDGVPTAVRSLNPNVSRDLETICMRCLEKNSEQRYATAAAVADELRRLQSGKPILARPVSHVTRLTRWAKRNPREASLWGGLALSVIVLFAAMTINGIRYRSLFQQEQAQRREVERTLDRSENNRYIGFIQQALLQYQAHNLKEVDEVLSLAIPEPEATDRRDWEWHYLNGLLEPGEFHFATNDVEAPWISALGITPSRRFLASGSSVPWYESMLQLKDVGVTVWDLTDGSIAFSGRVPGNSASTVALSDSGTRLAVVSHMVDRSPVKTTGQAFGSSSTRLSVFDLTSSQLLWELDDLEANYHQADFSADESYLATLAVDGFSVRSTLDGRVLWAEKQVDAFQICGTSVRIRKGKSERFLDLETGTERAEIEGLEALTCGEFLAVKDMRVMATVPEIELTLRSCLSWHGNFEASLRTENVVVQKWQSNVPVAELRVPNAGVAAFSADETLLAIGKGNGVIELWDLQHQTLVRQLFGHKGRLSQLRFTEDGTRLISGGWLGNVLVWDIEQNNTSIVLGTVGKAENPMEAFAARDLDSGILCAQWGEQGVVAFDPANGKPRPVAKLPAEIPKRAPGRTAAISQSAKLLAAAREDHPNRLWIWDLETAREIDTIEVAAPIKFVCFDPRGQYLACAAWQSDSDSSSDANTQVTVFDCVRGEVVFQKIFTNTRVWRMSLASEHPWLAVALSRPAHQMASVIDNETTSIALFDFQTKKRSWIHELPSESTLCLGLCLNESGDQLATGTLAGDVRLWNAVDGSLILHLEGVMENIEDLSFNPSGTRLAGATRTQVTLWGTRYGRRILSLPSPVASFDPIFNPQARFSADGSLLLCNQYDDTLRVLVGGKASDAQSIPRAALESPQPQNQKLLEH